MKKEKTNIEKWPIPNETLQGWRYTTKKSNTFIEKTHFKPLTTNLEKRTNL